MIWGAFCVMKTEFLNIIKTKLVHVMITGFELHESNKITVSKGSSLDETSVYFFLVLSTFYHSGNPDSMYY
jgi:hypothetical protein